MVAWPASGSHDAFLALDRNGNGRIENGTELFGNFTPQPNSPEPNGFLALAEFDKIENGGNEDGKIDSRDTVYWRLVVWDDENRDGVSQLSELRRLVDIGLESIDLDYKGSKSVDRFGDVFRYKTKVVGSVAKWVYDVDLRVQSCRN